ncbi:hypothetical protein VNO78_12085 [Psophocarpus tetragonolobus]|uniref:BHLH domain-containing protein n=1 Tax=Psophocarpus tetragonolobus TaxID=3891 RepID=A0AAN9XNP0_PSOTE
MAEDQASLDMDFLLENHSWDSSNSDDSSENKENIKPSSHKKEGESLLNKKRNREITNEDEKKNVTSGEEIDKKYLESGNEMPQLNERERRKRMNKMFEELRRLLKLPLRPSKPDKATIVDEAVTQIKVLEETLEKLEKQKQERSQYALKEIMGTPSAAFVTTGKLKVGFDKTWAASNMVLNIRGDEAQFSICSAHNPELMTTIASVLEKHSIELITASISCYDAGNGYTSMIQVHAKQASDSNSAEETYRKAAEEIMPWIA